jgi:hypothetical protein
MPHDGVHDRPVGLCSSCTHARVVVSGRGSRFILCGLSSTDRRFPRYPRLPVIACGGYRARRLPDEGSSPMDDQFTVSCPYCGEQGEVYVEPDVRGTFVQDCEVCCNPWRLRVLHEGGERRLEIARADGTE